MTTSLPKIMSDPNEFGDRITKLETTIGDDRESGLRGELHDIKESQKTLAERMRNMELRGYAVGGGVIVIIWLIEHTVAK